MADQPPLDKSIFLAAIEIGPAADRAAYVDQSCAGDLALRARVVALLAAHDNPPPLLEVPEDATSTCEGVGGSVPPGTVIGPYKLLQKIGEGGMGTVYMAEQTHPVRRQVALKLIKAGLDGRLVIARFEAERQALAMMDHVNIARVLDAGETSAAYTGGAPRPYFVMELVRGVPITKYCDDHHLTPRQRLELFVPVCQAIQHAHQKGIIHRDVKPSNVMVTLYEGRPVPKVIDFGVAKATDQKLTDRTLFTQFGTLVGTVEYMSPEQAEMSALGIDTRSDIYSLGVLLYELLTGSTPLSHQRMKEAAYGEILRIIKEEEPPRPSTRLSDSGAALASISAHRKTEPGKLSKLMRGELDWIVMKALEKDRNRRYETANGFGQDVQRYLADEPVLACPPSTAYRLGKFLRRHKRPVLAAALVVLALLGGGIGAAYGLIEARRQREVVSLWQQAEVARGEAEAARDGEATAKLAADRAREALAGVEYGRTMEVTLQEWRANNVPAALALLECTRTVLRGWEWRYVNRLCHADLFALKGHTSAILSAAFSPDGSRIVTGSEDTTTKVWDARTGSEVVTLRGHTGPVRSVAFSPDGSRVVTAAHDPLVRVWDVRTGTEVLALRGHAGAVFSAAYSPDGARIVTGGRDNTARLWDAKSGVELLTLKGVASPVLSVAFSPDGARVVTGHEDSTARVWDAKSGVEALVLRGHTGAVQAAAYSPDGTRVITGSRDGTARMWDAKSGVEILSLKGHTDSVTSAAYSPDGSRVVTGSHDRTARVWDTKSGAEILCLKGHTKAIASAAFSPDGARVVTGSGEPMARVWDARSGAEFVVLKGHAATIRSAAISPDGLRVITGGADNTAKVWDLTTGAEVQAFKGNAGVVPMATFSPDGLRVLTASSGRMPKSWNAATGAARVWDAKSGAELLALRGHTGDIWSVAYRADGARIVTGSEDDTARVWDAQSGAELVALRGHAGAVFSAAFSPDGARIVTGGRDTTARVWEASTGAEILVLKGHTDGITSAAFSPDGARIVTASRDRTARIWDAKSGAEIFALRGHAGPVYSAAFSPDRARVVTGSEDATAKVWDARTGAEVLSLRGHAGAVRSAVFSPDAARIITAGDTTARIWDARPIGRNH
jgi:eukaryotic-like serine/threonine-protein kinase